MVSLAGLTLSHSKACRSSITLCVTKRQQQIGRIRVRTYCISRKIDLCMKECTAFDTHFRPCPTTKSCYSVTLPVYQETLVVSSAGIRKSEIYSTSDRSSHCGLASCAVPTMDLFVIRNVKNEHILSLLYTFGAGNLED